MSRIKVRFNLGRGINYMKWKISYPNKVVEYFNPTEIQLILKNSELKNHKRIAQRIFEGGEKVVCAWILCDEIEIITSNFNQSDLQSKRIRYNPRIQPNWLFDNKIADGLKFNRIESVDYGLYLVD